jgi:hypothetical protein
MAIDTSVPRTRRALLAGGLGGLAALVASALGRPLPARAGTDGDVVLDAVNTATGTTKIVNTTSDVPVFTGQSTTGTGLYGRSTTQYGVRGHSASDSGVYATSGTGIAVEAALTGAGTAAISAYAANPATAAIDATADQGYAINVTGGGDGIQIIAAGSGISCEGGQTGIVAWSDPTTGGSGVVGTGHNDGAGVAGASEGNEPGSGGSGPGVHGFSGSGPGVSGETETGPAILGYSGKGGLPGQPTKAGVYGYADLDAGSRGVVGQSPTGWGVSGIATTGRGVSGQATTGRGVSGQATTGRGVSGQATTGLGVFGLATTGTAVLAQAADPMSGLGLRTIGRVRLDHCAGVATIPAGTDHITITPGIDLVSSSAVVATLQGTAGAVTTTVSRVFVNATTDQFVIYLTAKATVHVKVAWHVFG